MIKLKTLSHTAAVLLFIFFMMGLKTDAGPGSVVLEDFSSYKSHPFSEWKSRENISYAHKIYSIKNENGTKFLRATTEKTLKSIQLGKLVNEYKLMGKNKISWDIQQYPYIKWDWRIHTIPSGGNEKIKSKNDSAAAIYVVFPKNIIPFVSWQYQPANWIKYVWSSTLPVGTVVSREFSRFGLNLYQGRYVVVASGEKDLKKWLTFKRNVKVDYKRFFGEEPEYNPIVIGILTDANNTKSQAAADYSNIKASKD
jgi:hypothetical protein